CKEVRDGKETCQEDGYKESHSVEAKGKEADAQNNKDSKGEENGNEKGAREKNNCQTCGKEKDG
ncbi:MAG TPA: hypothetical protein PKE23_06575, partial [Anaerolineales bacterium]|nr:hypothetical protein [Anaerolineales bacterium]